MFYTNYANKEVMTVKGATPCGIIKGIYIDKSSKRADALLVESQSGEKALPLKKVVGNADKVTVYSESCIIDPDQDKLYPLTIDTQAYNEDGILLGNFIDMTTTGEKLVWFDKPYPVRYISGFAENRIVINLNARLQKKTDTPPRIKAQPESTVVDDYSFLIGRIVIRDIIDKSNNINIRKGTVINRSVLEQAKQGGKLVYLALSSLLD